MRAQRVYGLPLLHGLNVVGYHAFKLGSSVGRSDTVGRGAANVAAVRSQVGGEIDAAGGRQILEMVLEVASGRKTKCELHGIGDEEFAPWSIGPTL